MSPLDRHTFLVETQYYSNVQRRTVMPCFNSCVAAFVVHYLQHNTKNSNRNQKDNIIA